METVPAEHLPSGGDRVDDDPARRIEALRVGDRQRIFLHGRWSRVQLLWRSDRSLFFLFAGESPARTHSITRRALERLELGRAGAADRGQAAGAARGRSHDARHVAARAEGRQRASSRLDLGDDERGSLVDDPVRRAGHADDAQVGNERLEAVEQRRPAGRRRPRPRSRASARARSTAAGGSSIFITAIVGRRRRAQRRSAVVVAAAAQAGAPDLAIALAHRVGQPAAAGVRRIGRAHVGEERPEAREVVRARAAPRRRAGRGSSCRRSPPAAPGCRAARAGRSPDAAN